MTSGERVGEFVYVTEPIADAPIPAGTFATNGLVELLSISDSRLLALERSFSVGVGNAISIYEVSTDGASDVRDVESLDGFAFEPVSKELILDLGDLGITLDNVEGITFGPNLPDGRRTLILVSDNNFNAAGQFTQFLAFAVTGCAGDLDADGTIDGEDLGLLLTLWGEGDSQADLNQDGVVDAADLALLLAGWGGCP